MDLLELSQWLEQKMHDMAIPGHAKIEWIDVGDCSVDSLELNYCFDTNTVRIYQI